MQATVFELMGVGPWMQVDAIRHGLAVGDLVAVQEGLGLPLKELCAVIGLVPV